MKVKVEVPATNGRKAYSYMREGGQKTEPSKVQGGSPKGKVLKKGKGKEASRGRNLRNLALAGVALGGVLALRYAQEKETQERIKASRERTKKAEEKVERFREMKEEREKDKAKREKGNRSATRSRSLQDDGPFIDVKSEVVKDSYRADVKTRVDVPATANRKAYSYFREGGEGSAKPKSSSISKGAAAGLGAIALGGLAAGGLAISGSNKKRQQQDYKAKTDKALEGIGAKDREMSEAHAKNMKGLDESSRQTEDIGRDSPFAGLSEDELQKAREGIAATQKKVQDFRNSPKNSKSKAPEPFIDVKSEVIKDSPAIAPSESAKNTGSAINELDFGAIAESMKGKSTKEMGNARLMTGASPYRTYPKSEGAQEPSSEVGAEKPKSDPKFNAGPASAKDIEIAGKALRQSGNTDNTIAEPKKSLLTKVSGSAGAALGRLVRKGKEGWERDREAGGISSLQDKEYDLNQLANKAGKGTRSALEAVSNFANSFMQGFVESKDTVNTKASEVKTTQKAIPSRIRRPNKTISKSIRKNSLEYRIDSFIQSLRSKPCNTI